MRKLSLFALASFLILWGINLYIIRDDSLILPKMSKIKKPSSPKSNTGDPAIPVTAENEEDNQSDILKENNIRAIDQIGDVINDKTVQLDQETKEKINTEKIKFDNEQNLKEKISLLEQSFLDKQSSVKDIKRLQSEIQDLKIKMKQEVHNTEKWDPMFVYYMMISENYTYNEINQIKSLSENGMSKDELNYINDLIKQDSFKQQVLGYKNQGDVGRVVASFNTTKAKEKDEFIDGPDNAPVQEDKLIEMNYEQQ